MNSTFGKIKSSLLNKLTESYINKETKDIKDILTIINENRDFKELYLLYEDVENKYFEEVDTAKFYVDELSKSLNGKVTNIKNTVSNLSKNLNLNESNKVYDLLDTLLESDSLLTIDSKVKSKVELVKFLTTKKEINESNDNTYTNNEKLLMTVLSNDFNSYYSKALSESDKQKLKDILSFNNTELEVKTKELSESIINKISEILSESNDVDLKNKLDNVELEVKNLKPSKYNYFRLLELKNGLD